MEGWIKTHRSKLSWEWFTDYKTSHLFEYLLLCASHNEYKWRGTMFSKGQLPFGLKKASDECGLSVRMIRTSLDKLKSTNEVTIKTSNQGSVITIVNWDKYQIETSIETSKRQASDKQATTTKNVKNEKNTYSDEIINLFDDSEIIAWLKNGSNKKSQDVLMLKYKKTFLVSEIQKAYCWIEESGKKRKGGAFLVKWCENSFDKNKYNDEFNPVLIRVRAVEQKLLDM